MIKNFLELLESKLNMNSSSKKLQNWNDLKFSGLLKELKRLKVKLSLEAVAEWVKYFKGQKQKVGALKTEIDKTDREIDEIVYELYGLTEDEIAIVEETTK